MPTEHHSFFCAQDFNPYIRCTVQCGMCKDKEMKMAKEQPLFLLVAYFNDGRIPFMERSIILEGLQKFGENLLRNDSKCLSVVLYKPVSRTERAEFITDNFI